MFTREIVVRFGECDGLGHVNNGTYFDYMEDARIDVFRLFNPSLRLDKWNLIVASTRCDFLKQVTFAEALKVHTWIGKIGNTSLSVDHVLQNQAGEYVARGQAVMISYDYEKGAASPVPEEVRRQLESHAQGPQDAPVLRA